MRPLPICIVGLNFGRHIIDGLLEPTGRTYFRIAAVCDMDAEKAQAMGQKLGVKAYTDVDLLLADREIPVVGLFTGPNGRADLLRRMILAGKDVMTTKPFEIDPVQAGAILQEAADLGRVIHLNSPAPDVTPDMEQIARWREEYDLGYPIGARAETWVSYREKHNGTWYDDPERCPVAPVFRLGIYLINDLVDLFGPADRVQVMQSRIFTQRATPDNAQLSILFKNGALANVYASFCVGDGQPYRNSLTLNFERGTIYRNVGPKAQADEEPVQLVLTSQEESGKPIVVRQGVSGVSGHYQWREFYHAVQNHEPSTPAFAQKLVEGLRIISAMTRAEKTGCTAKVE